MPTRQEKASSRIAAAVQILTAAGYRPAGETRQETVRVGTSASPVLGGTGGELRTFGGRARFELPGTDQRATVGPQTTQLYRSVEGKAQDFVSLTTSDTAALSRALAETTRACQIDDCDLRHCTRCRSCMPYHQGPATLCASCDCDIEAEDAG